VSIQAKSESKTEVKVEVEADAKKTEEVAFELPPPSKKIVPFLNLPESLPNWNYSKDKKTKIIFDQDVHIRNIPYPESAMDYYITDRLPAAEGEIVETEMGMQTAAEYQYVHVKLKNSTTTKDLVVMTADGELDDKYHGRTGRLVQVQGIVQVLDLINSDEMIYRALVKKTIHPITVGAKLVAGNFPTLNASVTSAAVAFPAQIIGGQFANDRKLYSNESLVYLNAGQAQGLVLGQVLPIFKNPVLRNSETLQRMSPLKIGELKVVNLSDNFATAVVLNSSDEIRTGDATSADAKTN
jgi:hypothetical protein